MKKIKKAVIPVGGEGTRMFPMTKAFSKEFLPLCDINGKIKPAIMYLIEELDEIGIEEIYIMVTKKYQEEFYKHFFFDDVSDFCKDNLSLDNMSYLKKIKRISKKIRIYYEKNIRGFGHVLYYCNKFIHNESFLLLLGDQIYKSYDSCSCLKQIVDDYDGNLTISVSKVDIENVSKYGILNGKFIKDNSFLITNIKEKPTKLYAKKYLRMNYKNEESYFSVFGTYIINEKLLEEVKLFFDSENELKTEYQLTPFLEQYKGKKVAFIPNGKYFDIGNLESYNKTYIEFQKDYNKIKM